MSLLNTYVMSQFVEILHAHLLYLLLRLYEKIMYNVRQKQYTPLTQEQE